jgi:hypothetical protein
MSESAASKVLRIFSAIAMTVVAIVFGAIDLMLFKESSKHLKEVCKHPFGDTTILVLSIMSILTIAPAYMALRFFRGSVSSNGRTLLPANFFIGVGVFFLFVTFVCAVYSPSELPHILKATLPICIVFIWIGLKLRRGNIAAYDDKILKDL